MTGIKGPCIISEPRGMAGSGRSGSKPGEETAMEQMT